MSARERSPLRGMIGGWQAGQVRQFVRDFTKRHTASVWYIVGDDARRGLVDSAVLAIVFGLARGEDGGTIVVDNIRDLRSAFFEELRAVYGWRMETDE